MIIVKKLKCENTNIEMIGYFDVMNFLDDIRDLS